MNILENLKTSTDGMFAYMTPKLWLFGIILPFVLALAITAFIHPFIVRMAKSRNMVDEPDGRKLQRTPIPVISTPSIRLIELMIPQQAIKDKGKET